MKSNIKTLSELIAPHFYHSFNNRHTYIIDVGGRGSTKTSKNGLKIALDMINDSNYNVVAIRRNKNTIRDSLFAEIKLALSRLGMVEDVDYECTVSPLRLQMKKNDNFMIFAGGDDFNKIKGCIGNVKRKDNQQPKIKCVWISEFNEFKSPDEIDQIVATFSRGKKSYFYVLLESNVNKNKFHWTNLYIEKMKQSDDCFVQFSNYLTVPREFIGEKFIKIAEMLKKNDPERYENIYLGRAIGMEGSIYNSSLIELIDDLDANYRNRRQDSVFCCHLTRQSFFSSEDSVGTKDQIYC